jgi:DNA polymerase
MLVQQLEALRGFGMQQIGAVPAMAAAIAPAVVPMTGTATTSPSPAPAAPRWQAAASPTTEPLDMPRKSAASNAPPASPTTPGLRMLPYTSPCLGREERLELLGRMKKEAAGCLACQELVRNRTQTVFGVGNVMPRVVFFGEAPGADEDRQGEPFVGRAGQLLTKIIEACSFKREDVYILNVLKCRPPDNRPPEPGETANCRHYFERQFDALQPEYIACVGASPAQALLETTLSIGKLRGRFHEYRGSKVVCTYHPAYLLRNPDAKKYVWEDMQMMLRDMGIDPAQPNR